MAEQDGPLMKRVIFDGANVLLPADAVVQPTFQQLVETHAQCNRCKELGSICPSCEMALLEAELNRPLFGTYD